MMKKTEQILLFAFAAMSFFVAFLYAEVYAQESSSSPPPSVDWAAVTKVMKQWHAATDAFVAAHDLPPSNEREDLINEAAKEMKKWHDQVSDLLGVNDYGEENTFFEETDDPNADVKCCDEDDTDKEIKPAPEPPLPEDNKTDEQKSAGNPLMFSLPGYGDIEKRDIWPDQHESYQVLFPINNMCNVNMDTEYTSGFMLFWDHDYDWDISNGLEIGWVAHHPEMTNSYEYFDQFVFDNNGGKGNGILDRYDTLWHAIKVKDMATGQVYRPLDLGIIGFTMVDWVSIPDDYVTPGQYLDQDSYVKDYAYYDAIKAGWDFYEIPEEYKHPVRVLAWHPYGVIMEDHTYHPTYDVSLGYWGETSDC